LQTQIVWDDRAVLLPRDCRISGYIWNSIFCIDTQHKRRAAHAAPAAAVCDMKNAKGIMKVTFGTIIHHCGCSEEAWLGSWAPSYQMKCIVMRCQRPRQKQSHSPICMNVLYVPNNVEKQIMQFFVQLLLYLVVLVTSTHLYVYFRLQSTHAADS